HDRSGATDQAIDSPTHAASAASRPRQTTPARPGTGSDDPSATTASTANAPIQNSRPSDGPSPKNRAMNRSAPPAARVAGPASLAAFIGRRRYHGTRRAPPSLHTLYRAITGVSRPGSTLAFSRHSPWP